MMKHYLSFPIRSWVDLHQVLNMSACLAFHFQDCQKCFCLRLTLSTSGTLIFLIPGTFHPKRWSLSSALCPASKYFSLNSNPLNLALIGKAEVCVHPTLYPPCSRQFHFKGVTEYLEELVTRIDTPRLNCTNITFFNQINFDCPRV